MWQAKKSIGTGLTGVDGTFCWADLMTPDQERAGVFYSSLFGWKIEKEDEDPAHAYHHIRSGEEFIGGIPPAKHLDPHVPPHWQIYFTVSDCDAFATKANEFGAKLYLPPTTVEDVGRMAVVADPQGAPFALFQTARKSQAAPGAD